MSPLNELLESLRTAPDTQLDPHLRQLAIECSDNKDEIMALFKFIYAQPETERSRFVAEMVNPEFTSQY